MRSLFNLSQTEVYVKILPLLRETGPQGLSYIEEKRAKALQFLGKRHILHRDHQVTGKPVMTCPPFLLNKWQREHEDPKKRSSVPPVNGLPYISLGYGK